MISFLDVFFLTPHKTLLFFVQLSSGRFSNGTFPSGDNVLMIVKHHSTHLFDLGMVVYTTPFW